MQAAMTSTSPPMTVGKSDSSVLLNKRVINIPDAQDATSSSTNARHQSALFPKSHEESLKVWRNDMSVSAMKHFNMSRIDAEEWAMSLPIPSSFSATPALPPRRTSHERQAELNVQPSKTYVPQELATSTYESPFQQSYPQEPTASPETYPHAGVESTKKPITYVNEWDASLTDDLERLPLPFAGENLIGETDSSPFPDMGSTELTEKASAGIDTSCSPQTNDKESETRMELRPSQITVQILDPKPYFNTDNKSSHASDKFITHDDYSNAYGILSQAYSLSKRSLSYSQGYPPLSHTIQLTLATISLQ